MGLKATDIKKSFDGRNILGGVTLRAASGETVAIVGPSGCGKTTLLRIMAGLDTEYGGRVELEGEPVLGPSRRCGLMFQDGRLLPWMSAIRNVEFGFGLGVPDRRARAAHLLDLVGLRPEQHQLWPSQLSGGMVRRVALARSLGAEPKFLLLDEPFVALDPRARLELRDLLVSMRSSQAPANALKRATLVLVTHDISEAVSVSDRVFVLGSSEGTVVVESIAVELPYPRDDQSLEFRRLCERVLAALLSHPPAAS